VPVVRGLIGRDRGWVISGPHGRVKRAER
jgi:hypothetical protein